MKKQKQNISIRFDPDKLKLAKKLGIDLPDLCRQALNVAIQIKQEPLK